MVDVINPELLIKRALAWDILPCAVAPNSMKGLGLLPGSDGGDDLEHYKSHIRLNRIVPINDIVKVYSGLAGEVIGRSILEHQGREIEDDDDPKLKHYRDTVTACVQAVIANLIEAEILHMDEGLTA